MHWKCYVVDIYVAYIVRDKKYKIPPQIYVDYDIKG